MFKNKIKAIYLLMIFVTPWIVKGLIFTREINKIKIIKEINKIKIINLFLFLSVSCFSLVHFVRNTALT